MGEVIEFPTLNQLTINQAMDHFEAIYKKAGLSETEISSAKDQLTPIIKDIFSSKEHVFELPKDLHLNVEQVHAITSAHNECMQSALEFYNHQIGLLICNIAGLIGRSVQKS